MGKWTDMDSDEQRLPEGFERIGYDADDQTYTFRGPDGRTYQSAPGNRYGELRPVGQRATQPSDAEIEAQNAALKKDTRDSIRMMLPFALLVFVFLILLFKLVNRSDSDGMGKYIHCAEGSHQIQIHKGDTCWALGEQYRVGVEDMLQMDGNEEVDCTKLRIGQEICVPDIVD